MSETNGTPTTPSSSSSEVTFSLESFSKIILHVTKYPQHSVNGLLVRKRNKGGSSSSSSGTEGRKGLVIGDAIPLLHLSKYTTPMMEIALAQTDQFCKGSGHEIVGYYQANEGLKDNTPDFVTVKIAEKLAEVNPNILVITVNNELLNSNLECAPFNLYHWSDGKLRAKEAKISLLPDEDGALSTVSALIQAKVYRTLVDFDNHMDDISLNYWANPLVNEMIEQLSS